MGMLSVSTPSARRAGAEENAGVPCIRLFCEPLQFERGGGLSTKYREISTPVIQLSFDYGGVRVRCTDPVARVFRSSRSGTSSVERNRRAEARAQYLLESFGAVEIGCLSDCAAAPDSDADYLVHTSDNVHALCSFTAYALPQLKAMGWRVEVDREYPYQVVTAEAPWYAEIEAEEQTDWFGLELGIDVAGRRINLLPALLDLIDRSAGIDQLDSLTRATGRCFALPTGDGRYVPLPPERLRTLVRVLLELYNGEVDRSALRFTADAAAALVHLDDAMELQLGRQQRVGPGSRPCAGRASGAGRDRAAGRPAGDDAAVPASGPGLAAEPARPRRRRHPCRRHGPGQDPADDRAPRVRERGGADGRAGAGGRADQPGGQLDARARPVRAQPALHGHARPGAARAVGEARHLRRGGHHLPVLVRDGEQLAEREFHLLILDEAQAIKNRRSQAHRAVHAVRARHRLCLSGTPVENDLDELWSLFDFLMPGFLGTPEQFRCCFATRSRRWAARAGSRRCASAWRRTSCAA